MSVVTTKPAAPPLDDRIGFLEVSLRRRNDDVRVQMATIASLQADKAKLREALEGWQLAFEGSACCTAYTATGMDAMQPLLRAAEQARAALAATQGGTP